VPPGRRRRQHLLPLLMFTDAALACCSLTHAQKVHLAQRMTLQTYARGAYGARTHGEAERGRGAAATGSRRVGFDEVGFSHGKVGRERGVSVALAVTE
jgi:hypothetical protein